MSKKTDEELVKIITIDKDLYQSFALEAAEYEIKKRGIGVSKIEKQKIVNEDKVSSGKRFINYFIDLIIIFILISGLGNFSEILHYGRLTTFGFFSIFILYFLYYVFMEYTFQKTIGKFITKTKVVTKEGEKPRLYKIIIRTVCRFIPYDLYSYAYTDKGFHDYSSDTRVININARNSF
jgi:uncharacterized RDD family membrane protein YckC